MEINMRLKKILFIIEYLPAHELLSRTLMELWLGGYEAQRFTAQDAEAYVRQQAEDENGAAQAGAGAGGGQNAGVSADGVPSADGARGILIVTDSAELAKDYLARGFAVMGYVHERNRDASFDKVRYLIEDISGLSAAYCELAYCRAHGLPLTLLRTKRCVLREMAEDDLDRLYEIYAQPGMTDYIEPLYADRQEEAAYIRDYIRNVYGFYGYGMWIVESKEDGSVIGRAGIEPKPAQGVGDAEKCAVSAERGAGDAEAYAVDSAAGAAAPKEDEQELGYVIAREYQGQGYATEVCGAILDYAADELGLSEIRARIDPANRASVRVCEKLGFSPLNGGTANGSQQTWIKKILF